MKFKIEKKWIFLVFIFIGIIGFITFGFTYAKYASNSLWNYYLSSKGFYFTADYLGINNIKNINNLWDGSSVHFTLSNKENDLVVTDYDINYEVKCNIKGANADDYKCSLNKTGNDTITGTLSSYETCINNTGDGVDVSSYIQSECEINGYTWQKEAAIKDMYFDITKNDGGEVKEAEVEIVAKSLNPYKKTLIGTFKLQLDPTLAGTVSLNYNESDYLSKVVVSNSYSSLQCVKLSWNPNDFRIDNNNFTNYEENENGYISSITFKMNSKSSQEIIFYRTDFSKNFDQSAFNITLSDNCQN